MRSAESRSEALFSDLLAQSLQTAKALDDVVVEMVTLLLVHAHARVATTALLLVFLVTDRFSWGT